MADGILERFGILFESDSEEVKQGIDDAESAADGLEDKLSDVDKTTSELGDSFLDLIGNAKGAIAGLLSAGAIVGGIVNAAAMTDEVGKFSEVLGLNISDVSAWSEAVTRAGGDANGFRGSVKSLTDGLTEFSINGSGPAVDVLARLGVSATTAGGKVKTAFQLLPELADAFQGLSRAESAGFGQKLGLDQGTILLLQQGRTAVNDLVAKQRELGVATQEDYEIAAKFNDQMADSKQSFNALFISIGSHVLPIFTRLLDGMKNVSDFLYENKDFVTGFFIAIASVVTAVYLPAMLSAAAATLAAASPFILVGLAVTAAATAFALLYDDIINFIAGHDSFIGKISKDYPIVGELVHALVDGIGRSFESLQWIGQFLIDIFTQPQVALEKLSGLAKNVAADISGAFSDIQDFFGLGDEDILTKNIIAANSTFEGISANPLNGQTSNSIVNTNRISSRSTSVSVGEVNVNTQSTDPEGMAAGARSVLQDQLQSAVNDFDNGVRI